MIYAHMEASISMRVPNHPKLDHFSIETHGFGDPPLKKKHRILNISSSLKYSDRPFLRVNPSKVKTMPKQTLVAGVKARLIDPD